MKGGRNKNRQIVALERAQQAVDLYRQGHQTAQIAATIGVSEKQVYTYLRTAREKASERFREYSDLYADEQLAKLAEVRQAAWEGWKRSLRNDRMRSKTVTTSTESHSDSETTSQRRSNGDPRFLAILARAIDSESKILGVQDRPPSEEEANNKAPRIVTVVIEDRDQAQDMVLNYSQFRQKASTSEASSDQPPDES